MVLPINKFINHPSYKDGPGEGYDISLYFVGDAKLKKQGVVKEGVLYPACLPQNGDLLVGNKGIFASWKYPLPLHIYYKFGFERTVKRYRNDELVLRHTRMDIVECKDPNWMKSNTFYPRAVLCGIDPSCESCLDSGDSGSGLVMRREDGESYSWVGPLSFYRGCDRAANERLDLRANAFNGENPGIFTNGGCYLSWIARHYGMVADNTGADCDKTVGDFNDKGKSDCLTVRAEM